MSFRDMLLPLAIGLMTLAILQLAAVLGYVFWTTWSSWMAS